MPQQCQLCHKQVSVVNHRVVPVWVEPNWTETIKICNGCQAKVDNLWFNVFKTGQIKTEHHTYRKEERIPKLQYKRKFICAQCGIKLQTDLHHLLPYWMGGTIQDSLEHCKSCHGKLESRFNNFVKYGNFKVKVHKNEPYIASDRRAYYRTRHQTKAWKQYMHNYYLKHQKLLLERQRIYYEKSKLLP